MVNANNLVSDIDTYYFKNSNFTVVGYGESEIVIHWALDIDKPDATAGQSLLYELPTDECEDCDDVLTSHSQAFKFLE